MSISNDKNTIEQDNERNGDNVYKNSLLTLVVDKLGESHVITKNVETFTDYSMIISDDIIVDLASRIGIWVPFPEYGISRGFYSPIDTQATTREYTQRIVETVNIIKKMNISEEQIKEWIRIQPDQLLHIFRTDPRFKDDPSLYIADLNRDGKLDENSYVWKDRLTIMLRIH